jgi:hypothetical protein
MGKAVMRHSTNQIARRGLECKGIHSLCARKGMSCAIIFELQAEVASKADVTATAETADSMAEHLTCSHQSHSKHV